MSQDVTSDILNRLKSIEGHVGGIARMVESDQYCVDILNQIVAVQRALDKVNSRVLDRHLHTCAHPPPFEETIPMNGSGSLERF